MDLILHLDLKQLFSKAQQAYCWRILGGAKGNIFYFNSYVVILMFIIKYTYGTCDFMAGITEDAATVVYMIIHLT